PPLSGGAATGFVSSLTSFFSVLMFSSLPDPRDFWPLSLAGWAGASARSAGARASAAATVTTANRRLITCPPSSTRPPRPRRERSMDHDLDAAVQRVILVGAAREQRLALAPAHRAQLVGGQLELGDQEALHRLGPAQREPLVVRLLAQHVGVAHDLEAVAAQR